MPGFRYQRLSSPRLKTWDYTRTGHYFVTICVNDRLPFFGNIQNNMMILNEPGEIVSDIWKRVPDLWTSISLDAWIVMPDHMHGIVHLQFGTTKPLSDIIGAFKTLSSKQIHLSGYPEFRWQRSFHDRIIRDDDELNRIREYIVNNPKRKNNNINKRRDRSRPVPTGKRNNGKPIVVTSSWPQSTGPRCSGS